MKRGIALLTALLLTLGCIQGFGTPAMAQDISGWKGPEGRTLTASWPGTFTDGAAVVRSANEGELVRLYKEANTESEILLLYYDGVQLELISAGTDGWCNVRLGTLEGYIQSADLALDEASLPKSKILQLTINPGEPAGARPKTVPTAPLRMEPNTSARTLASYAKGVTALLLGYCDGWCQLFVKDKIGFMQTKYLWADPAAVPDTSYQFDNGSSPYFDSYDYMDIVPESGIDPASYYPGSQVNYNVGVWTVQDPSYNAAVNNPNPYDHLNLREEADELSPSMGKYYNGARVIVHYVEEDIGWALVTIGSITGYMKMDYLAFSSDGYYPMSAMPLMYLYNPNTSRTSLLEDKTPYARIVGQYQNGTPITVMGYSDGWLHVIIEGRIGFLQTAYAASVYNPSPIPETFSWNGPVGPHSVADWPLAYTGVTVNNPNPKDRLNLRTSPSSTAASKGKYYNGVQVSVLETLENGWVKAQIGSQTGYMDTTFLSNGYVASAMPVVTTTGQVHLRASMSTKSTSLDLLPKGTAVILIGLTSQWGHVIAGGQMGFIYAKYLK